MNSIIRLYALLVHLYPRRFRDEFGDEMCTVFADMLAETKKRGNIALMMTCLKEVHDLPGAILREHWRARIKAIMDNDPRVSSRELLGTAIPFLLYLVFPIMKGVKIGWAGIVILLIPGALIISLLAGLFKGMPRWSLPAMGLVLAILNYFLFSLVDPNFDPLASSPRFLHQFFGSGFPYIGISVLTLIVVLAIALLRPLRPFFHRVRHDYTLFPLALYGIMPLVMLTSFDEYQGDVPYQIGMGLVLLASLWLYLLDTQPRRKLLVLGIGITLAMAIEAIGKWIIVPSQNWGIWFQWHTIEQATQIEVISTVYTWFWVMVMVFLPALLGLLPHEKQLATTPQV